MIPFASSVELVDRSTASLPSPLPETLALDMAVVLPTYNECDNIPLLVAQLTEVLEGLAWEAIFVDDDSPDGTADVVTAIARRDSRIRLIRRIGRRGLSSAWRTVLIVSVATVLATAAVIALKYAFGRLWPETWIENNPSWISNHEFGFRPFHGGAGYESFPSGHTARITAPFAVLWQRLPRYRVVWVLAPLLVMAGLLAADFHLIHNHLRHGLLQPRQCAPGLGYS